MKPMFNEEHKPHEQKYSQLSNDVLYFYDLNMEDSSTLYNQWYNKMVYWISVPKLKLPETATFINCPKEPMWKLQKIINKRFFTEEKLDELADLVVELESTSETFSKLVWVVRDIVYKFRLTSEQLEDAVRENNIKAVERLQKQATSYISELDSKDMLTLLWLALKWNKEEKLENESLLLNS